MLAPSHRHDDPRPGRRLPAPALAVAGCVLALATVGTRAGWGEAALAAVAAALAAAAVWTRVTAPPEVVPTPGDEDCAGGEAPGRTGLSRRGADGAVAST